MEVKLLSNGVKYETVPEVYIVPPERRPGNPNLAGISKTLPVIDLQGSKSDGEDTIANQIIEAGKEFGFFQVINHGIPQGVINDMMGVAKEFFDLPLEDKAVYYSEDPNKIPRLFTGTSFRDGETAYWRDCLVLSCYPVEEFIHLFPGKPSNFREVVARYVTETVGLGMRLLKLISKGLGLEEDYFSGKLSGGPNLLVVNHYPPCPDPSLTLGLPSHCDPNLLTILLQGNVRGLQVLHGGEWIGVEPTPNALVVNFGHALEMVTNGLLRSMEHRAVTNPTISRTSVAVFLKPTEDCLMEPAQLVVDKYNPPLYRSFLYQDLILAYFTRKADRERIMDVFRIKN